MPPPDDHNPAPAAEPLTIEVPPAGSVSALLTGRAGAVACLVMAHGAGAGMTHPFMAAVAAGLARRRIATLRYQFPSCESGARRPDRPAVAHATVRAAVAEAARRCPALPLVAGGKSFGGRMTSQAQAEAALPHVAGVAFLGFPLHPAGKPSAARAAHLAEVAVPMLFLQGTRDGLAERTLIAATVHGLGSRARLELVPDADHAFRVPVRSGRTDAQVLDGMLEALSTWIQHLVDARP